MIGAKAGPYVLERLLGEGGMGAVYLARHERLPLQKAVKVLLPEYSRHPDILRRFENEAMAAARLKHRNIIGIDDFGQLADGQWYIIMPFLEGVSLERFLADRGQLTIHQTLHLMAQVCAGLQAAHEQGIVHRDLKPANIFISHTPTNPFHVTVLDFGIAKLRGDGKPGQTQTGMIIGTPIYMAAELFEDSGRADVRSDIFALGVIAYQLVSGDLPFGAFTAVILYNRQLNDRPVPPAHLPAAWATALLQALALRPADRYDSARAFALSLASGTPADPPYEPSGAEIVTAVAPELLTSGAAEATVKNASDAGRIAVLLWPRPETPAPQPARHALPQAVAPTPGLKLDAVDRTPTPVWLAASGEPSQPVVSATPTTLSSASGPIASAGPARASRYLPLLVVLSLVGVGLLVAIVVVVMRKDDSSPPVRPAVVVFDAASFAATLPPDAPTTQAPVDAFAQSDAATTIVVIETVPPGATLEIDGKQSGPSPQRVERPIGAALKIRAKLTGHKTAVETRTISAADERITLRLERRGKQPAISGSASFDPDDVGGD